MKRHADIFEKIISPANLFLAWEEFYQDKKQKADVQQFAFALEQHMFQLCRDLKSQKYKHGQYKGFWIRDPKLRRIHKATVRDRVLHHSIFRILNPIFEPTFISTSFSCRVGKGTHRGVKYLAETIRAVSKNYTKPCFVLKCDIRKFFDSVDHGVLPEIIGARIKDHRATTLVEEIVGSYSSMSTVFTRERERERERAKKRRAREYPSAISPANCLPIFT